MELVYLWVEDYKNIHRQGFNFSPRFNCNYDPDNNELTIDKNDDYIENFFGDNINVTAIVGKNGSGKSNIFEAMLCNLMYNEFVPIDEEIAILSVYYDRNNKQYSYKKLHGGLLDIDVNKINGIDITLEDKLSKKYKLTTEPFTFHYNYSLDWINNNEHNLDFDKLYHKNDDYRTSILLQPNKANRKISLDNIDYLATRDILNFTIKNDIKFDFIEEFFVPVSCELKYNISDISKKDDNVFYEKLEKLSELTWEIEHFKTEAYYYILRKTIDKGEKNKYDFIKDESFKTKLLENKLEDNFDELITCISQDDFENLYDDSIEYITRKIKETYKFIDYTQGMQTKPFGFDLIKGKKQIADDNELLLNLPPYVQIEFFDEKDVSLYSLSYGQKFIIKFIYSLLNQLENLKSHDYRDINLLLDEVEQGLHPEWQKKFLNLLIQVLKEQTNFKFNIICATHSPFILSDIPKQNIYFMKDGKQNAGVKKQTFGANIHTLLSDSFFMEDGLMGEFAKKKINEIIDFLNDKKKIEDISTKKEQIEQVIESIGEPFLKSKLLDMYNRKFIYEYKIREEKRIDEQIRILQEKRENL